MNLILQIQPEYITSWAALNSRKIGSQPTPGIPPWVWFVFGKQNSSTHSGGGAISSYFILSFTVLDSFDPPCSFFLQSLFFFVSFFETLPPFRYRINIQQSSAIGVWIFSYPVLPSYFKNACNDLMFGPLVGSRGVRRQKGLRLDGGRGFDTILEVKSCEDPSQRPDNRWRWKKRVFFSTL